SSKSWSGTPGRCAAPGSPCTLDQAGSGRLRAPAGSDYARDASGVRWANRVESIPSIMAQAALLFAARPIRPRVGRRSEVSSGDEGGRKPASRDGAGGGALCRRAAIRQSNITPGGESRDVGSQIDRNALSGLALWHSIAD